MSFQDLLTSKRWPLLGLASMMGGWALSTGQPVASALRYAYQRVSWVWHTSNVEVADELSHEALCIVSSSFLNSRGSTSTHV